MNGDYAGSAHDFRLMGFSWRDLVTAEDLRQAALTLERAFEPMGRKALVQALTVMRLRCMPINEPAETTKMRMEIYIRDLLLHPADIVLRAIEDHGQRSKFFPSWCDLYETIEELSRFRVELRKAISRELAKFGDK